MDIELPLADLLSSALERRRGLLARLATEDTDCYRLFHGATEGRPGLTIDRYGGYLLAQTWHDPPGPDELRIIESTLGGPLDLPLVWNHRGRERMPAPPLPAGLTGAPRGRELGLGYDLPPRHRGQDPLLFLDLRAGRRLLLAESAGCSVLNTFAYTCGIGLCAARGGAREVWNVDFSASALAVGRANATLNELDGARIHALQEDVLPVLRQLAGLSVPLRRGKRRRYLRVEPRQFDWVVLDPPTWATGPFGAIDVVRDYQSLFKPALLATAPGGRILATNHAPGVEREDWIAVLERCAEKAGRPLADLRTLEPEADFPSPDGRPLLKMVVVRVP